jgi:hypothetical protein
LDTAVRGGIGAGYTADAELPRHFPDTGIAMKQPSLAGKKLTDYYHVCAFFDSQKDEHRVLSPFYAEGIEWGEKVMLIVDPALKQDQVDQLRVHGIDTDGCQQCGQLEVHSWDDVYLSGGTFDADRMIGAIDGALQAGKEAGYPRMRIMGNMGWTLKGKPGTEQVIEFESRVNDVLSRQGQLAVCVYDTAQMSGGMMMDILRTHPLTLVGNIVHENPFYVPAEQLLDELRSRRAAPARERAASSTNV